MDIKNIDLNYILQEIEKRPGLYLGNFDVYNLWSFISAYKVFKINFTQKDKAFFKNFNEWIENYYGEENKTKGWAQIIVFHKSPYGAFEEFFKLYKEWYKEEFGEDAW